MHSNDVSVSRIASNFLPLPILPFLYLWLDTRVVSEKTELVDGDFPSDELIELIVN